MRDNATSYQQSIQLESKVKELETEKDILQQQRDIANKEREKVVMESVAHKVCLGRSQSGVYALVCVVSPAHRKNLNRSRVSVKKMLRNW